MGEFMNVSLWFISSYFFFTFKDLSVSEFLTLLFCICGSLLIWYYKRENMKFHQRIFNVVIGISAAYVWKFGYWKNLIYGGNFRIFNQIVWNSGAFFLEVIGLVFLICISRIIYCNWENGNVAPKSKEINSSKHQIFEERLDDCKKLKSLLSGFDAIGIDSPWGAGKTFLVDYFCSTEEIRNSYEVIRIPALSYNYDEYDYLVLGEIDSILNANHIFSHDVISLRKILSDSPVLVFLYKLFFGWRTDTTIANFETIKNKVNFLEKKILIIFEDIERADTFSIQKIFSIGDRLAGKNVKIIYEYAGDKLDAKGLDREYRNKYIYADMYLTDLSFKTLLNMYWESLEMDQIKLMKRIDLQKELSDMIHFTNHRFVLSGNRYVYNTDITSFSVRWIKHFLEEVKSYLQINPDIDQIEMQVAIRMFFIKSTNFKLFEKFQASKSLDELFKFKDYDGKELSLYQITEQKLELEAELSKTRVGEKDEYLNGKVKENKERYMDIINNPENNESVYVFSLFDNYEFTQHIRWEKDSARQNLMDNDWLYKSTLEEDECNEHINRVIWNVLENGKSHLTDNEAIAKRFINEVLALPSDADKEINARMNKIFSDYYNGNGYKDNKTTQMMGEDFLLAIARSLYFSGVNNEIWRKFIARYPILEAEQNLDISFIKICSYVEIYDSEILLIDLLNLFNHQRIIDNLSDFKEYTDLLGTLLRKMVMFKFLGIFNLPFDGYNLMKDSEMVVKSLAKILKSLKNTHVISSDKYKKEQQIICNFLQKNIDIYRHQKTGRAQSGSSVKIGNFMSGPSRNQAVVDKILELVEKDQSYKDFEVFNGLVSKYYDQGLLTRRELKGLINEWNKRYAQ